MVFGVKAQQQKKAHILSMDIAAYYTHKDHLCEENPREKPIQNNNYPLVTGLFTGTILASFEKILVACSKIYKAWSSVNRPS